MEPVKSGTYYCAEVSFNSGSGPHARLDGKHENKPVARVFEKRSSIFREFIYEVDPSNPEIVFLGDEKVRVDCSKTTIMVGPITRKQEVDMVVNTNRFHTIILSQKTGGQGNTMFENVDCVGKYVSKTGKYNDWYIFQ